MSVGRLGIGAVGVAVMAFGAWTLLRNDEVLQVAPWVVLPPLLHDLVVAPVIIVLVWLARRVLPPAARVPAMVGLVVSGALVAVGLSVVGRQGASTGNPSLLDRNYVLGLAVALTCVWLTAIAWALIRLRQLDRSEA